MRVTHCPRPGEVTLREAALPRPERAGEVLLRVRRCGICGSDLHWYTGETPAPRVCPGHEISAVVEAVGPAVRDVREGDRVAVEGVRACGQCSFCREGRPQLCPKLAILGLTADGGFADYVLTDERHLYPVPPAIDDETAQLAEPLAVGVHALGLAGFERDQRLLVLGAGTVGLLAVPAARQAGAGQIAISARRPHQKTAALALGAHQAIDPSELRNHLARDADGFDVVVDTVADRGGTSLDDALQAVRPGGTVIVVGVYTARPPLDALRLMTHEIRLLGSMCYGRAGGRADFEIALDILEREGDHVRGQIVTHRVPLGQIAEGFRLAADKTTGSIKVSVAISDPEPTDPE